MGKSFYSNTNYKITKFFPSPSDLKVSTLTQHLAFGFTDFLIIIFSLAYSTNLRDKIHESCHWFQSLITKMSKFSNQLLSESVINH